MADKEADTSQLLLAIDAGNTNVVFAAFAGDRLLGSWRSATDARRTPDEYRLFLQLWLAEAGLHANQFRHAIIASVVPELDFTLKTLCRQVVRAEPLIVGESPLDLGMPILLPHPQELGADRLVDAVAARSLYPLPLIIVDFGTATTFNVVDAAGYRGGVIAPGINLSLQALHMAAAKLPPVQVKHPEKIIGTTTVEAMQSGVYWGYISLIEGVVTRIQKEYAATVSPAPMLVIATGGLAPLFKNGTSVIQKVDSDLTIIGLQVIFNRQR